MKNADNQLEFVQKALEATPRSEWDAIASAASISTRNLYNIMNNTVSPSYEAVFALMKVFEARRLSRKGAATRSKS